MATLKKKKQKQMKRLRRAQKRRAKAFSQRSAPGVRMSEVISHLAEPIVDALEGSTHSIELGIRLTILAWNATLIPADQRVKKNAQILAEACKDAPEMSVLLQWALDTVAAGKARFYPHLNTVIHDVKFTPESADSVYFEVAYSTVGIDNSTA